MSFHQIIAILCILGLFALYVYGVVKKNTVKGRKMWNSIEREILWVAVPAVVFYCFFTLTFSVADIQSGSMEPTLMTGDRALINQMAYIGNREIKRGDIVVFWFEEQQEYFGKRVIGLPGDEISFEDGKVYINGEILDESSYLDPSVETLCVKEFTVPEGSYFLLGDNRRSSLDSRYWKNPYIEKKAIKGKYLCRFPF